jgi:hypothetical protein
MVRIDISICPTDLPENNGCGDGHGPNVVLAELKAFVDKVYPGADVRCLQIGHRQGDGWAAVDGDDEAGARFMEDFWSAYN